MNIDDLKITPRPHVVREKCQIRHNWGIPDAEFTEWVRDKYRDTGYIEIRMIRGRTLDYKMVIKTAVIYYEK